MSTSGREGVESRLLAIVVERPGELRPNELARVSGLRRKRALAGIRALRESRAVRLDQDGFVVLGPGR